MSLLMHHVFQLSWIILDYAGPTGSDLTSQPESASKGMVRKHRRLDAPGPWKEDFENKCGKYVLIYIHSQWWTRWTFVKNRIKYAHAQNDHKAFYISRCTRKTGIILTCNWDGNNWSQPSGNCWSRSTRNVLLETTRGNTAPVFEQYLKQVVCQSLLRAWRYCSS